MLKIYTKTIILFLLAFGIKTNAQCTGCTINVTGLDAANYVITSGQTLCVASTGTMTGLITISYNGTLCNEGTINSTNLWVSGGTFNNYGTVNTNSVLVSSAGSFTNSGTALIDSLLITEVYSAYLNTGTQIGTALAITVNASAVNTGSINVYNMGDSLGLFTNSGNLTITNDFYNSYSSNFTNNNYMKIAHNFYNSTSATFRPNCMMLVQNDWYNSAYIYRPSTGCGGFNITGASYNSGVIGYTGAAVDICDAGHPAFGLDGAGGTINANTTYCSCTNDCSIITGVKETIKESSVLISTIFPNPASDNLTVTLKNNQSEILTIEVRDMMGRTVMTKSFNVNTGNNDTELNVSNLAQGTYILSVTDSHQLQTKRLFSVVK